MDIDDDDDNLGKKIKQFLSKDSNFRNPAFDPAPYLIKILKEKEASQDFISKKQQQLIQIQNDAQELLEQLSFEQSQQFFKLLEVPEKFGDQLQKLKHNMCNVKKKVKETKSLLLMTQKDIQQIHLNCLFNKIIYKKLKQVQLRLNQYETASVALKNNMFLECAQNLPAISGYSILESALAARSQNLKLRFLSQAIEQVRIFLFFTSKIVLPTSRTLTERATQQNEYLTQSQHEGFFKRYQLFKQANSQQYLSQIWKFNDLQRRAGKIGIVYDIIRGIMRIGKTPEITQSIDIDCQKSISNIYLILCFFFAREKRQAQSQKQCSWFTSPRHQSHSIFMSALLCVSGALIRKLIIVRKIIKEYQIEDLKTNSGTALGLVLSEICKIIKFIYFPELAPVSTGQQIMLQEIVGKVRNIGNFVFWPYFRNMLQRSCVILKNSLQKIEQSQFGLKCKQFVNPYEAFNQIDGNFFPYFHASFSKTLQQFFNQEGRSFNIESFEQIVSKRQYTQKDISICQAYCSEEKKSIKQFVNLVSLLNSLRDYFRANNFEQNKFKKYVSYLLLYFYLKLHSHVYRHLIPFASFDKIIQTRLRDAKVKAKQKALQSAFYVLIDPSTQIKSKLLKKTSRYQQAEASQFRNVEKLRMIKSQIEMLFCFCCKYFPQIEEFKAKQNVKFFESEILKLEAANYDENIPAKLIRIWDQLAEGQSQLNQMLASIFKKLFDILLNVGAYVYIESGIY